MKLIKCAEHKEIFELENNIKRWVENWNTFVYLHYDINNVEIISFNELKSYKVGDTLKVTTVTKIIKGKAPKELFYPDKPEVPVRKMTVLGTVLNGCEHVAADIGCTHIIGNGYGWGDYDLFEELGGKSIINLKPYDASAPTKEFIKKRMDKWINRRGCGGWWCDDGIRGEEPDGQPWTKEHAEEQLGWRRWLYKIVRDKDPDSINHPVVEQFNMTEQGVVAGAWRSGWKGQYSENPMTCDVNLWTCYTAGEGTADAMYQSQSKWYDVFPDKYMKKVQLIPQISVEHYWEHSGDNSIAAAYRNWKKIMSNHGLQIGGMAYYSWLLIRVNEDAQNAIKEVNKEIIKEVI
ncbi:hypothetical protein LCGC14_0407050 [marine sediment metagenome]|uniref:Glycoside hydrolase 123 C-terminal domain-containing protein n=1 Tax=marine sediment metagenome TaxID=412755 RepID=A0A0F9SV35_9ZZZZ